MNADFYVGGGQREAAATHVSKRTRRDKSVEAVFDEKARREFLTGFHKRKKQRRKVAVQQQESKARLDRIEARKERRDKLKEVLQRYDAEPPGGGGGEEPEPAEIQYPGGVTVTVAALDEEEEELATGRGAAARKQHAHR